MVLYRINSWTVFQSEMCSLWVVCILQLLSWLPSGAVCKPQPATTRLPDMVLQLNIHNATATFIAYKYRPGMVGSPGEEGVADGMGEGGVNGTAEEAVYDGEGAMYFAVAVILIYGVSIALLVGSTLHRHDYEYEVKGFLRSYARIDQQKRTREKQKVRRHLIEKNMLSMLPGCTLAATPSLLGGVAGRPLASDAATLGSARSSEMTSLTEVDEEAEGSGKEVFEVKSILGEIGESSEGGGEVAPSSSNQQGQEVVQDTLTQDQPQDIQL